MTVTALAGLLAGINSPQPATIYIETVPKMRKTGNPFVGRIVKRSKLNGMIGFDYENSVNNQKLREGGEATFETQAVEWREYLSKSLIRHKVNQTLYANIKVQRVLETVEYLCDGKLIDKSAFAEFLDKPRKAGKQGVERDVIVRTPMLDNIREFHWNGIFQIVQDRPSADISAEVIAQGRAHDAAQAGAVIESVNTVPQTA